MALQLLVFILVVFGGSSLGRLESVVTSTRRIVVGNETDQLALFEFKKQIDDPYGALHSWNNTNHFCNWVGVTCGHRHQRVISLELEEKGLGGNISPSIGNLSFLHLLNIANNSFHGEIPQEIGNLIRLEYIHFDNNSLQGEIPISLANCTCVREIHFSTNNLNGKIPVELTTSLSKLEWISINYNGLTGEIPASFGNMSSLQVISLGGNELQGRIPESLGQLTNLYGLALLENKLSEYGMGGKTTTHGDVFSYGILLLEMFIGKRPTDKMFTDDLTLHNLAKVALPMQVMQILDPTLLPKVEHGEEIEGESINGTEGPTHRTDKLQDCIISIFEIALQCSMDSPRERMNMNDVVRKLYLIKGNYLGARI